MKVNDILNEGARNGSKQFRQALRGAAEAILKEAESAAMDEWKNNPGIKENYKTRKEFLEAELRELCEQELEKFTDQIDDEVDVVLTHKHGI